MFACKESDLVLEKHGNCASRFGRGYPCFAFSRPSQFTTEFWCIHINYQLSEMSHDTCHSSSPVKMDIVDRNYLDCDPFGVVPINDTTPPFICALFGHDPPVPLARQI